MTTDYDTILVLDKTTEPNQMLEAVTDPRLLPPNKPYGKDVYGQFTGQDPNSQLSLGPVIKSQLSGLGQNYSTEVFDFGSDVTVSVKYSNPKTGLSAECSFLIKYMTKEGKGIIKSNSVRYRTISSHSEAISYIKNRVNSLQNRTSSTS